MPYRFFRLLRFVLLLLVLCASTHGQNVNPPAHDSPEPKAPGIKEVNLLAWQVIEKKKRYAEVREFRETQKLQLIPSDKFDVECEVVGGLDPMATDYILWTTVDFLVAPVTRAYEQMSDSELSSSVGWGQITYMRDIKAIPIYFLPPKETRRVIVKGLDLSPVLASFTVGDAGELWPWLVRIRIHVQDRFGKQMAVAERTMRISPSSARKTSHYKDPLPNR